MVLLKFASAANLKVACTITVTRPIQVGNRIHELFKMLYSSLADLLCVENSDTGGHVAACATTKVGRNDKLFNLFGDQLRRQR